MFIRVDWRIFYELFLSNFNNYYEFYKELYDYV